MTQLEQLQIIVDKEIKTKKWLASHDANTSKSKYYWDGGIAALQYIKHVIDRLITQKDGE